MPRDVHREVAFVMAKLRDSRLNADELRVWARGMVQRDAEKSK